MSPYYTLSGSGPPVVLLHSFLCSGAMWSGQVESLSKHHTVINIDFPGHGRSSPVHGPIRLEHLVDSVLTVLDHEEIPTAAWAGLSIGGMVALRAALRVPDRVSSLLLFDTDAGAEHRLKRVEYRAMSLVAKTLGVRPLLGPIVRKMFGRTTIETNPTLVAEWRNQFASVDVPSVLRILQALIQRRDLSDDLEEIEVQTLVAVGTEDVSLPPERSRRIAKTIPNSQYIELARAGHLSVLEQPELASEVMLQHLAH